MDPLVHTRAQGTVEIVHLIRRTCSEEGENTSPKRPTWQKFRKGFFRGVNIVESKMRNKSAVFQNFRFHFIYSVLVGQSSYI